jgi:DHA1 family inner membrane transport protein
VGIAFGSVAGGVAIGSFTTSAGVITGLIIAVTAVPVAWATSSLKPPVVQEAAEPAAALRPREPTPDAA